MELPASLRLLAHLPCEVTLSVQEPVTQRTVLDALEDAYPMLCGTLRNQQTKLRRPFIRFFACEQDLSHHSPDEPLPGPVQRGEEPLLVIGAIAGG